MKTLEIHLTQHAVERLHERVRPALSLRDAEDELARLITLGQIQTEAPGWHSERQKQRADAYLVVSDLVLPLAQIDDEPVALVAVTCIARGGLSDEARARRNQLRRERFHRARPRRGAGLAGYPRAA